MSKKSNKTQNNQYLKMDIYNPVVDLFDNNKGPSKKANAPAANKARGASYSKRGKK